MMWPASCGISATGLCIRATMSVLTCARSDATSAVSRSSETRCLTPWSAVAGNPKSSLPGGFPRVPVRRAERACSSGQAPPAARLGGQFIRLGADEGTAAQQRSGAVVVGRGVVGCRGHRNRDRRPAYQRGRRLDRRHPAADPGGRERPGPCPCLDRRSRRLDVMSPAAAPLPVSDDALLGGRVKLLQPVEGYRVAIDPVLLAAAVPAGAGDSVLDLGCGVGAAALCLAARVPGCRVTGVEVQRELVWLAGDR